MQRVGYYIISALRRSGRKFRPQVYNFLIIKLMVFVLLFVLLLLFYHDAIGGVGLTRA